MTHGLGTKISVAAAAALTALVPVTTAHAATSDPEVTITDGCGRVDFLDIDVRGSYWLQVLPDGKAPKKATTPIPDGLSAEEEAAFKRGLIRIGDSWRRTDDDSKSFLLIRVLQYTGNGTFEYLPLLLAGSDNTRGTEQFKLTNEDCVQLAEPTFVDEVGSANDTVTIPSVRGVKYSGKPGVSPGKGTVTVTATPDKGFRLATPDGIPLPEDQTRWTHTFDATSSVQVPDNRIPTLRLGDPIPATKTKPAGRGPNIVTVKHVPGVTWIVDGKPQKTSEKATTIEVPVGTKTSVEVQAVSADPKAYALSGTTEWVIKLGGPATKPAAPTVRASTESLMLGASTVQWAPPAGYPATSKFNVRYRVITLTGNNVRARAPWRPWTQETRARSAVMRAKPGSIIEVTAQAVANGRVSPWSSATTVWFPTDVRSAPGRTWRMIKQNGAVGGTMAITPQRNSAWTAKTPTTNRIMLWFGTSPTGAPAAIYVDGRRVATVNTRHKNTKVRQVLKPIPVSWGKHVVTVVHNGPNGKTLRLDGVAYGR